MTAKDELINEESFITLSSTSVTVFTGLNGVASAEQTHVVKENAKLSDVARHRLI